MTHPPHRPSHNPTRPSPLGLPHPEVQPLPKIHRNIKLHENHHQLIRLDIQRHSRCRYVALPTPHRSICSSSFRKSHLLTAAITGLPIVVTASRCAVHDVGAVADDFTRQSHKSFRTKQKLAKAQKQNRPVPQWIRLRTGNTIRCVPSQLPDLYLPHFPQLDLKCKPPPLQSSSRYTQSHRSIPHSC